MNEYKIGDIVIYKHSGEEATIIEIGETWIVADTHHGTLYAPKVMFDHK